MPENIQFDNFSTGWVPSDDPVAGRKNGLLRLESLELDNNGAVVMSGGTKRIGNAYPATVHSIFSKFLNGIKYRWAVTGTNIYRNNTSLAAATSTRAAFGVAYDFVMIMAGGTRIKDTGMTTFSIGLVTPSGFTSFASGGAGNLTGDYEYAQVLVNNQGNGYVGKSKLHHSGLITLAAESVNIDPVAPATMDSQANENWIFRRGGLLDTWYRVYIDTTGAAFNDNLTDNEVLDIGVTYNENIVPVTGSFITEPILSIVGPVDRRHLYFTNNKCYFSEINSPDSTDLNTAIAITGDSSELFLWAIKSGENVVVVGTTEEVYILTGSFITQPDGTLDVYYRALGVDESPIGIDVACYGNSLFYMAACGWVQLDITGTTKALCPPNIDVLYRGTTKNLNKGVPIYVHPALRYSCATAKNKLWTVVPQIENNDTIYPFTYRMDIYDFIRGYWRTLPLSPTMLFGEEDNNLIGFFNDDKYLKDIDNQFYKTLDNATTDNQTIDFQTLFNDGGNFKNEKDPTNLILNVDTGNTALNVNCYTNGDLNAAPINLGSIQANGLTDLTLDISGLINNKRNFSLRINGAATDFRLTKLNLIYEPHPDLIKYFNILRYGLGDMNYNKVRIRTLPFVINTKGQNVTITPSVDGVTATSATINNNRKGVYLYQFLSDVFGIDYSVVMQGAAGFEVWDVGAPDIVQILPMAKRFFQVGPLELFQYGKIKAFEFRIIPFGGTVIPYTIYFQDTSTISSNLNFIDGKDSVVDLTIPKTIAGTILRLELGPTAFDFHVLAARVQANLSGKDTEMEWISLK